MSLDVYNQVDEVDVASAILSGELSFNKIMVAIHDDDSGRRDRLLKLIDEDSGGSQSENEASKLAHTMADAMHWLPDDA